MTRKEFEEKVKIAERVYEGVRSGIGIVCGTLFGIGMYTIAKRLPTKTRCALAVTAGYCIDQMIEDISYDWFKTQYKIQCSELEDRYFSEMESELSYVIETEEP